AKSLNKQQVKISQFVFMIVNFFKLISYIYLLDFNKYVYIYLLGCILEIFITLFFIPKELFYIKFKKKYLRKVIKESYPLFLQSLAIYIYMKLDQIMIGQMRGPGDVGIYSIGVFIAEMVYLVPVIVNTVFYPKISKYFNQDLQLFKRRIILLSKLTMGISLIFAIFCNILGKKFFLYFYGMEYVISYKVLLIYCWTGVFVSLGVIQNTYLVLTKKQKVSLKSNIYAAIINVILNYILILKYGIIGAAVSTLISQIFVNYVFYLFIMESEREIYQLRKKSFEIGKKDIKSIINLFKEDF
ncbi:MAG: flippase, partial [Cetobacterium sp.]